MPIPRIIAKLLARIVPVLVACCVCVMVRAQAISSVTISPGGAVVGGTNVALTVRLTSSASTNVIIRLAYTGALSGPSSFNISSGQSSGSVPIFARAVAASTPSSVIATPLTGAARSATITVSPPAFTSFTLTPSSVVGGFSTVGTVTLNGRAPEPGLAVTLATNKTAATPPASVTIPAGALSLTFDVGTQAVTQSLHVTITARIGTVNKTANLTILPPSLSAFTVSPSTVVGGAGATGTVVLTGPAPTGGVTVAIGNANQSQSSAPTSVAIPAGTSSATFPITTRTVLAKTSTRLTATYLTTGLSRSVSILPETATGTGIDLLSPWPKFRGNIFNTGFTTNAAWTWDFIADSDGNVDSSPAIGTDGTMYYGSNDGNITAINPATGTPKWQVKTTDRVVSSPVITRSGQIIIGSGDHYVYCLNPATGSVVWKFQTLAPILSTAAIAANGNCYIASSDGTLFSLNQSTGAKVWSLKFPNRIVSSPNLGNDGTLYIGCDDGRLYAIDTTSASVRWSYLTGGPVQSSPALGGNLNVYVGSMDGTLYALNAKNGTLVWSWATDWSIFSSPCVSSTGVVCVGSQDEFVYALNSTTGAFVWESYIGEPVDSSPALDENNNVVVGADDGNLYLLDGLTGKKLFTAATGSRIVSSPAVGAKGVFVGGGKSARKRTMSQYAPSGTNNILGCGIDGFSTTSGPTTGTVSSLFNPLGPGGQGLGPNIGSGLVVGMTGNLYLSYRTGVYVCNPVTKQLIGEAHFEPAYGQTPAMAPDGTVFFCAGTSIVAMSHNLEKGLDWLAQPEGLDGIFSGSPVLDQAGNVYAWNASSSYLYCLDPKTGAVLWRNFFPLNGAVAISIDKNDILYAIGTTDARMYAIDTRTRTTMWNTFTVYPVESFLHVPVPTPDGNVIIRVANGNVYKVSSRTGAIMWGNSNVPGRSYAPVRVRADGTIFFANAGATSYDVVMLNGIDGVWIPNTALSRQTPMVGSLILAGSNVFWAASEGSMKGFDSSTGRVLLNLNQSVHFYQTPAISRTGTMYFLDDVGNVYVVK